MQEPLDLVIVATSLLVAGAVECALAGSPLALHPEQRVDLNSVHSLEAAQPQILLLAPRTWREFERLLSEVPPSLSECRWLILADLRLVGLFLSRLKHRPCAIVDIHSPPEQLTNALTALSAGELTCMEAQMMRRFVHGLPPSGLGALRQLPSPVELQCGCGVSLGLRSGEMAQVLHVSECTIKSHLHRLMRKLGVLDRRDLALLVRQVFVTILPTSGGR
jgi:DNA-binding NarL/FixJ family response regulator